MGGPIYGHLMSEPGHPQRGGLPQDVPGGRRLLQLSWEAPSPSWSLPLGPQDPLPLFEPYAKMKPGAGGGVRLRVQEDAEPVEGTDSYVLLEPCNRYRLPISTAIRLPGGGQKDRKPEYRLLLDMFNVH